MGLRRLITLVLAVGAGLALQTPPEARSAADRSCRSFVEFGREGFVLEIARFEVTATRVRCAKARRMARAFHTRGRRPDGWTCAGSHFEGSCWVGERRRVSYVAVDVVGRTCRLPGELYAQAGLGSAEVHRLTCRRTTRILRAWADAGSPDRGPSGFTCKKTSFEGPGPVDQFECKRRRSRLFFGVGG